MSPSPVRFLFVVPLLVASVGLSGAAAGEPQIGTAHAKVRPTVETTPVPHSGDAADDPALWVDRRHPGRSLVIGNDKKGGLEVYNLRGERRQRITSADSFWGNVDVRQRVRIGGERLDVVAAMNRGLRIFTVDAGRRLVSIVDTVGDESLPTGGGEGLCLYESRVDGRVYVFVIRRDGRLRQFRITDPDRDGRLGITRVRQFQVGSEAEGCVADPVTGALYVSEEVVGVWRYGAEPSAGPARTMVDRVRPRGHVAADAEGITLVERGRRGVLIVSAQSSGRPNKSYFTVYARRAGNDFIGSFRIATGHRADMCSRTDGIHAYAGRLGKAFPEGIFICQDDRNTAPRRGLQNFKFTPLQRILPLK